MVHSRLAPSSANRWVWCPGSACGEEGEPGEANDAANFGTFCHDEASHLIVNGDSTKIDKSVLEMITAYVDHVKAEHERIGGKLYVEVRIESDIPEHGGTLDALIVTDDSLHAYDLKTGHIAVTAEENYQFGCYLNLAREKFPGRTTFYATVCQPRAFAIESSEYSLQWLDELREKVRDAGTRTDFVPGEHCAYCPLLLQCEIVRNRVRELVMSNPESIAEWTEIVNYGKVFENLVSKGKAFLLGEIQSGASVEGYKAANWFGHRKWIDEEIAEKVLLDNGVDPDKLYNIKLHTPAQIEKIVKSTEGLQFDIKPLVTKGEPVVVLAPTNSRLREVKYGNEFEDSSDG